MTDIQAIRHIEKTKTSWRWLRYLFLGLITNAAIWSLALLYLKTTKPSYISQFALVLPGAGPGVSVNLPEIGQASASGGSAVANSTSDPRANYDYLLVSEPVLTGAANSLKIELKKFGKPKIKLIDNTTIIQVNITGSSPEETQKKAYALYQAFNNKLNSLRREAVKIRDKGTQKTLSSAQEKLETAQNRLSQYKARSGLSSPDQIKNLSVNIELLRKQKAEGLAQEQSLKNRFQQLSQILGLSPEQAAEAFALYSDAVFLQNLKDYSEATATLNIYLDKWGENHPEVVKEQFRKDSAQKALLARIKFILGKDLDLNLLNIFNLNSNPPGESRTKLFQELISIQADLRGIKAQIDTLIEQIKLLENRFQILAKKESTLDSLQRDLEIAEAIFASTLAKLDLGKGELFADYPLVQMLVEPNLPEEATAPKKKLILGGALLGSIFCSIGIALLWWRQRIIKKIIKRKVLPGN